MFQSACLCQKNTCSTFHKKIVFKHETVFNRFEGTVIAKCTRCGLLKTFPLSGSTTFNPAQSRGKMYEQENDKFVPLFMPIVEAVRQSTPGGSVLDVGCSSGLLLSLLKDQGYDVHGIEPNATAFALARKKLGNTIFRGTLKTYLEHNNKRFDCIIYNHVLEHIPDVTGELELVSQTIMPGGTLIVGVPNTANIIFLIRGKYWEPLMPDEHVWHFSAHYMEQLLKNYGFQVSEKIFSDDQRQDYPLRKRLYFKTLSFLNNLWGTGEAVLLVTKKK